MALLPHPVQGEMVTERQIAWWLVASWAAVFVLGLFVGAWAAADGARLARLNNENIACSSALKHELELFENCMRRRSNDDQ